MDFKPNSMMNITRPRFRSDFKKISLDTENSMIGFVTVLIILVIVIYCFF